MSRASEKAPGKDPSVHPEQGGEAPAGLCSGAHWENHLGIGQRRCRRAGSPEVLNCAAVPPGDTCDIWRHLVVTAGGRGSWWVEARDAVKHPTNHRTAHDREGSAQSIIGAEVEAPSGCSQESPVVWTPGVG